MPVEPRTCRSCGRRITWRKKWARDWDQVRYCSQGCRRRGVGVDDLRADDLVRELVRVTRAGVSDAAVAARITWGPEAERLATARRAARRLVAAGEVEIVQGGRVVDPSTAAGPVLVRRRS